MTDKFESFYPQEKADMENEKRLAELSLELEALNWEKKIRNKGYKTFTEKDINPEENDKFKTYYFFDIENEKSLLNKLKELVVQRNQKSNIYSYEVDLFVDHGKKSMRVSKESLYGYSGKPIEEGM